MNLTLTRYGYLPFGTYGEMVMPSGVKLYTVERPWLDNKPSISCIPPGQYDCVPAYFFRGDYAAVEITKVPGRAHILFHIANKPTELEGCIAVCSSLGILDGMLAGMGSKAAFDLFLNFYGKAPFRLTIAEFCLKKFSA